MKNSHYYLLFSFLFLMFQSCSTPKAPLKIALSKASGSANYEKYVAWLKDTEKQNEYIDLINFSPNEACAILDSCDGLVLTGGPDLNTKYFGDAKDTALCEIDPHRDALDMALASKAYAKKLPVLAICRGVQIENVSFGGNLIVDIPRDKPSEILHKAKEGSADHKIIIQDYSYLKKFLKDSVITVNSYHHQAVGKVAYFFTIGSMAEDGIVESLEWRDPSNKPYFLGVQWHPERLDWSHPLSSPIAKDFLEAVRANKKK